MADRRCPYCKELVPEFSVNCPRCYRDIPPERSGRATVDPGRVPSTRSVNRKVVALLALVPSALGVMGLGHLYQKEFRKGVFFLCVGLVFMMAIVTSVRNISNGPLGPLSVVFTVFMVIMFLGAYVVQAFDAIVRSLFKP